jgi:transposase
MSNCIGLDISKRLIAVHIPINKSDIEIVNTLDGIKKLYSKLKKLYKKEYENLIFIYEPTGSYSSMLTKFCNQKEIKCFVINPKQFSNHSKALGQRVKSDKIDAQVLSSAIHLARDGEVRVPQYDKIVEEIKELMGYYKFTTKIKTKAINHLESLKAKDGSSYAISDLNKTINNYKKRQVDIIAQVKKIIKADDKLSQGYENITSIKGIGEIGGIALLHLFIKYPKANQRQITSLAGLDPIDKSSGSSVQTKPRISKAGSRLYRGSLFMGVMTAIAYDDNFKAFFARLKANGKHTTLAQIAVMRKMVIIAHSLYKNNKKYDEEVYKKAVGISE